MVIENVGLAMDTLELTNDVVTGRGTVHSQDAEGLALDYYDDFKFTYDTIDDILITDLDKKVFGDYMYIIKAILIDNLKTNYLK